MRKLFSLLLILLLATQADIYAKKVKQLTPTITWELKKDGTLIISGTGEMPDLDRRDYPWAQKANRISSIIICDGITKIGDCSFANYSFVGPYRKRYKISTLILPATLKEIGWSAFVGNYNLSTVKIPLGVTYIGEQAFEDCGITKLSLPSTIKVIGESAFYKNNISELRIPEGIEEIGKHAFQNCKLKKLYLPSTIKVISLNVFSNDYNSNEYIMELYIPEGVKEIHRGAFANSLSKHSTLYVPNSVNLIGYGAFAERMYHNNDILSEFKGTIKKLPQFINEQDECERIGIAWSSYEKYDPTDRDFYEKGMELYNRGDYKTALTYFIKGTSAKRRLENGYKKYYTWCYEFAGVCYEKLNELTDALLMFSKANELGNNCYSAISRIEKTLTVNKWQNKGQEDLKKGNYDSSFNSYVELFKYYEKIEKYTNHLDILHTIPKHFEEKEDYSNAVQYYKKVYDITKDGSTASHIGEIYYNQHKYDDAVEWFAIEANKGFREAQYKLAMSYEKTKNTNLAIFWYRKSAENGYIRSEESLARFGIYLTKNSLEETRSSNTKNTTPSQTNNQPNSNTPILEPSYNNNSNGSSTSSTKNYTPEYGFRDVWVQCTQCLGSGKCFACHGEGWCVSTRTDGSFISRYKCNICFGVGKCTTCYGSGGHYEKQMYQVK